MVIRRIVAVSVAATMLTVAKSPPAFAQTTASVVRVTDTSQWRRPSPDPTGVVYQRSTGRLIVVDSEVEETPLYDGANVWFTSRRAVPKGSWSTIAFSHEPTDVTVRGRRTFFFSNDDRDKVLRVRRGADRTWGTQDDQVTSFSTRSFGSRDPEGLAFARLRRGAFLFIADGNGAEVYRIAPGPNGRFDGVAPVGDDVVSSFDTRALGLTDPKGVAFEAGTRLLYLVSHAEDTIVRVTPMGRFVDAIDISSSGILHPSGITLAPGSDDPSVMHVFVTDKGLDNNPHPDENDGRIFEFALSS